MAEETCVSLDQRDGVTVATVHLSELNSTVTDTLLAALRDSLELGRGIKLVMDLSNVRFIDSVALGGLVLLLRRVKQSNGQLALAGLSGHCLRIMQVTGLQKVFDLYGNVASAVGELTKGA